MENNHKIKLNTTTAEIPEPLDEQKLTYILTEVAIYAVESRDNQDGTRDIIYKCKSFGSTEVRQGDQNYIAKNKSSYSQRLRQRLWTINPSESFYEKVMNKLITNAEEVVSWLETI